MADSMGDPVAGAAARLEAAVDRLAAVAGAARKAIDAHAVPGAVAAEGVSRDEVRALAERLDIALVRLKTMLGEED